ncbi:MAG: ParA family protein [Planctomycetes bacterium]|nr:ParA family protein [Planctomycetota bacterium]
MGREGRAGCKGPLRPDDPSWAESRSKSDETLLRDYLKPVLVDFDFVLIDMPGNADRRQKLVLNGLTMSDFVLVPTKPDQISLAALPDSFDLIHYAQAANGGSRPAIVGIVRNMTDRRTQQYRAKFPAIIEAAASQNLPPIFENFLANHPALETATDGTQDFRTLKQRFGNDYDPVRLVARELENRCRDYQFTNAAPRSNYGGVFRRLLESFGSAGGLPARAVGNSFASAFLGGKPSATRAVGKAPGTWPSPLLRASLGPACSPSTNRLVRTRMLGGVGAGRGDPPGYPIGRVLVSIRKRLPNKAP